MGNITNSKQEKLKFHIENLGLPNELIRETYDLNSVKAL